MSFWRKIINANMSYPRIVNKVLEKIFCILNVTIFYNTQDDVGILNYFPSIKKLY